MRPRRGHAIMVAFPFQGHITPYMNLAMKLASKGILVTFVHLEFIHHKLLSSLSEPDPFPLAQKSGLDIRYTTISDGFPMDHNRDDDQYWEFMLLNFWIRVDEFVGKLIRSDPDLVPFLVTDTLFTWQTAVAEKHNLLRVSFWTEPALVFSLTYHAQLLRENGHYPCKDHVEEEINYVEGVKSMNTKDLMPYLKEYRSRTLVHKVQMKAFDEVKKADFILHNTVYELESDTLSALNKIQPNYAVGPISFSRNLPPSVTRTLWSESDCSVWLQSKPPGSVLYVSFGSSLQDSKQIVGEIAYGLLLSKVSFVWVVREDADLPSGFRDEIAERGLVVPWCNQIKVLSDPAVGGFFTHCGWNSVLESMWCGVPMICHPLDYDQPTNRKLVVDDWKVGINLCEGGCVEREEVCEKMNRFMNGGVSERLRKEMKTVRAKLHDALENDGSSEANFEQFVKDLNAKLASNAE
ncbi:UDP-glycosyltransferase 86A1-like [Salvia hispanica]|uniref:UDP-glycosyltransferase 86A1-like n=1 Tax=Salvia hispanica TaxID=49212 RepID=UPI002009D81D|nr:UDP-glycosyltransferase 86A1-like [Salvia hispanica]